jgi:hypothetical protein
MEKDDFHAEIGQILNGISGKVLEVILIEWESGRKSALKQEVNTSTKLPFISEPTFSRPAKALILISNETSCRNGSEFAAHGGTLAVQQCIFDPGNAAVAGVGKVIFDASAVVSSDNHFIPWATVSPTPSSSPCPTPLRITHPLSASSPRGPSLDLPQLPNFSDSGFPGQILSVPRSVPIRATRPHLAALSAWKQIDEPRKLSVLLPQTLSHS